jgi:glycosyltransferase involved in cell wall biosynthesis
MLKICFLNFGRRGCSPILQECFAKACDDTGAAEVFIALSKQSDRYAEASQLPYTRFDMDTHSGYVSALISLLRIPSRRKAFRRFIVENKIDVVCSVMANHLSALLCDALKGTGAKFCTILHETVAVSHLPKEMITGKLVGRELRHCDYIITLTDHIKEAASQQYGIDLDRIYTIPHAVYEFAQPRARRIAGESSYEVLFFGRIIPYKGLDLLLDAWTEIKKAVPQACLRVIGEGDCASFMSFIDSRDDVVLDNRFVEDSEIEGILEASHLVVLPYKRASQSGVIAAAMGAGLPVVCTNVGALSEQVQDGVTGAIAKDVTAGAVAESVISVLSDSAHYEQLSVNTLQVVEEHFSWDAVGQRLVEIMQRELGERC